MHKSCTNDFSAAQLSEDLKEDSPLRRALRSHFERFQGLTALTVSRPENTIYIDTESQREPRIEIATVALRPQRDDI